MKKIAKSLIIIFTSVISLILVIVITFIAMLGFTVLSDWDKYGVQTTLWFNESKIEYSDGGFGDFTNYGEYHFKKKSMRKFTDSKWYSQVTENDAENLYGYFSDYEQAVSQTEFAKGYTFNKDIQINAGDYFNIYTLEGQPIGDRKYGKYDNYNIYYVDMETNTVYYIHTNI